MGNFTRSRQSKLAFLFFLVLGLTLAVYLLRGFGLLSFLPGGILLFLIFITLIAGILAGTDKMRRF